MNVEHWCYGKHTHVEIIIIMTKRRGADRYASELASWLGDVDCGNDKSPAMSRLLDGRSRIHAYHHHNSYMHRSEDLRHKNNIVPRRL